MTARILVADDNEALSQLLELILLEHDYEVFLASDGDDLIRKAQVLVPDLMIVDVIMPYVDGYEAIRQLRNDTRLSHIPIIVLTACTSVQDVVTGFETGADDYITKPFQIPELLARVRAQLARANRRPVLNPLTGLPGNTLIEEEINHRLRIDEPFALLYIDLDNFKAFNDTYGFARGDQVIKLLAQLLLDLKHEATDSVTFVGHIGGDDFVMLMDPRAVVAVCESLIARFDAAVPSLYDPIDAKPDAGAVRRPLPLQTVSIGVVTNSVHNFASYQAISQVAAEMKGLAKKQPGSIYVVDRRARQSEVAQERRSAALTALLLGGDGPLMRDVAAALERLPYFSVVRDHGAARPDIAVMVDAPPAAGAAGAPVWATPGAPAEDVPTIALWLDRAAEPPILRFSVAAAARPHVPLHEYLALVMHLLRLEAR